MVALGMLALVETVLPIAPLSAGVHSMTNTYIEPSNNDWIKPRHKTLKSVRIDMKALFRD